MPMFVTTAPCSTRSLLKAVIISTVWLFLHSAPVTARQNQPEKVTINYCIDPDWMPYEAIQNGEHIGISADYLAIISAKTGLHFKLIATNSWSETLQRLQRGECSLSPMLNRSDDREQYLRFSDVYFRAPNVLVSLHRQPFLQNMENIGSRSLAVPKGYRLIEHIQRYYPLTPVLLVESEAAGLMAVSEGKADLFVGSLYSVNRHVQQNAMSQLKVAGWLGLEDELRIGVNHTHQALLPLLNKALATISEAEHIAIYQKWTRLQINDVTNYQLVWQLGVVAAIIIMLLAAWNYRSRYFNLRLQEQNQQLEQTRRDLESAVEKLEFLSNHDPLTHLYNRNHFDNTVRQVQQRKSSTGQCFSLALVDIDYFKQINDNFGHSVGDEILRELANILRSTAREQDQVTRWGGEEFVIFCQHSTAAETQILCERIVAAIAAFSFSHDICLTCSFGIAEQRENEDLRHCFERADKALYKAKQAGRNRICQA